MPPHILVVDDDDATRDSLAELLEMSGYRVSVAANGSEALHRLLAGARPCLVVLDLLMPVMSGWDLRVRMLGDPRLADVPVLVVSGAADVATAEGLAAIACLAKPFVFAELLRLIESHCGRPLPVEA